MLALIVWSWFTGLASAALPNTNVILITIDGVRWQEIFRGIDHTINDKLFGEIFPYFRNELFPRGIIFGNQNHSMTVSNSTNISLPGYQSIMAGFPQDCDSNSCGKIRVETLQERLIRERGFRRSEVASFASWKHIRDAVEHIDGSTTVNAGLEAFDEGDGDDELRRTNEAQMRDIPRWNDARFDRFTFRFALNYLKKHRPRFLYISWNDADEYGHLDDYSLYINNLQMVDRWIQEVMQTLNALGTYGENTLLIVTTDHGRGADPSNWTDHDANVHASRYIWLFAHGKSVSRHSPLSGRTYSHVDIRPTIEAAFGLRPRTCTQCGYVIEEIVRQEHPEAKYSPTP